MKKRFFETDVCYASNSRIVNNSGMACVRMLGNPLCLVKEADSVFVATRCQAVENVNYRVHRLATVATLLAKWRYPAKKTASLV